ncbi:MAG TPA: UDP-3-O-acyl-N-acetylglucosamine deacetylase [Synergistaceae bacterium]|nr:UDP-3-O-acyl-N-acetylglucosamine deacetylase [Synergistaceae bacterium]HQH77676.1 UDP-3-O-acyl-N-acetylglucosamine deacetylase [Synergistaceae bacterium]
MSRTVARPVTFFGRGLHTGESCRVTVHPSSEGGVRFRLSGNSFPVEEARFSGDGRGTTLAFPRGGSVATVEHLMGTLSGLGIWHATVEVEGPEIPVEDGSAAPLAALILEAGTGPAAPVIPWAVPFPVAVDDPDRGRFAVALPGEGCKISYVLDYASPFLGTQIQDLEWTPESFCRQIAPARTFALLEEVEELRRRGLVRGGSLENSVVVGAEGVMNAGGWRFPREGVCHKVLDLMGDLALVGRPLEGRFLVCRGGHALHLALLRRLRSLGAGGPKR